MVQPNYYLKILPESVILNLSSEVNLNKETPESFFLKDFQGLCFCQ